MSPYRGGNSRSKSPISRFNRNSDSRQILPSPRELIAQADAIAKERYKWEKYRLQYVLYRNLFSKFLNLKLF